MGYFIIYSEANGSTYIKSYETQEGVLEWLRIYADDYASVSIIKGVMVAVKAKTVYVIEEE